MVIFLSELYYDKLFPTNAALQYCMMMCGCDLHEEKMRAHHHRKDIIIIIIVLAKNFILKNEKSLLEAVVLNFKKNFKIETSHRPSPRAG
jgi:flagellar motor component MotA